MINFYHNTLTDSARSKQLSCGESLIAEYNCPLQKRLQDAWSHHGYIVYVLDGRKVWHTTDGSYDLRKGSCVFVRKGASIIEQFFDSTFCVVFVFLPDEFICEVLKARATPIHKTNTRYNSVIAIDRSAALETFFQSMTLYFGSLTQPDPALVELKFRELVLTIAGNPRNTELLSYFGSLLSKPHSVSLRQVMEDNFCYNLTLGEFARLSNRSLSGFKREFRKEFNTTAGKWLLEKRLHHALHLLSNAYKTVGEAAFESGFESPSHFSRAFRNRFGFAPASVKLQIAV